MKRVILPIAFLALTSQPFAVSLPAQHMKAPAMDLVHSARPLVIAHRGYSAVAPENTLPSFKLALATGADLIELDYYFSKDGIPVVVHDSTLDRTTDATNRWGGKGIRAETRTAAELLSLDAGKWFSPQYAGTKLPSLDESLEVIQGGGGMTLIERKEGDAASMARLLRERNLMNQVVVQAFDWQYLHELHALAPDQVLGALGVPKLLADGTKPTIKDKALSAAWLDELMKTGAKVVGWNKEVSKEAVALAHQRGLKVWVYTVNDSETANALLDMGVDGIITDNPGLIWRTLALRAMK
jgi:glycerophosphoryl diester phosphodiesterase